MHSVLLIHTFFFPSPNVCLKETTTWLESKGGITARMSEGKKDKNIQQFVPRAVNQTEMMETYTRGKRKEKFIVTGGNS